MAGGQILDATRLPVLPLAARCRCWTSGRCRTYHRCAACFDAGREGFVFTGYDEHGEYVAYKAKRRELLEEACDEDRDAILDSDDPPEEKDQQDRLHGGQSAAHVAEACRRRIGRPRRGHRQGRPLGWEQRDPADPDSSRGERLLGGVGRRDPRPPSGVQRARPAVQSRLGRSRALGLLRTDVERSR